MYHFMVVVECETQLVAIDDPFFDLAYIAHHFNQLAFRAVAHGAPRLDNGLHAHPRHRHGVVKTHGLVQQVMDVHRLAALPHCFLHELFAYGELP